MSAMELLSNRIAKFQISLGSVLVLFITIQTILLNLVFATKDCDFPAIFNFGDSNSDTGGLAASLQPLKPPYGETYFNRPAGRFSDGRLIIDFIAQSFGLPYLSAYLNSLGSNFTHGANFATSGSTIRPPKSILPQGLFSPFYFEVQYTQFSVFKSTTNFIRHQGGTFATLIPEEEYFAKALYTIDIGQNDLSEGFLGNKTMQEVKASIPNIVNSFSANVMKIYDLGARTFWIHNTGPVGCLPIILVNFPSAERDCHGCAKPHNEVAKHFNQKLKEAVDQLRRDLPLATMTYVDMYSVKYSLFSNPEKYGFEHPLVTCCGYGGEYNYNLRAICGETIQVNDSEILVGSCERPFVRVIWDGEHYTEAANKVIFNEISTGAFSDPPLSLSMACHKSSTKSTEL